MRKGGLWYIDKEIRMKIMLVGDVVGRTGRKAFDRYTKELRQKYNLDMVIVN